MGAHARLRRVADAIGIRLAPAPMALASDSNDVWRVGDLVLRICWRGDRARLPREAVLLAHLPDAVPHAPLVDGADGDVELSGRAADLVVHLWNRPPEQPVSLAGDESLWGVWREHAVIR